MPSPSEVHVSVPLSNLAIKFPNPEFVGERILPVIPVMKESDKYYIHDKTDRRRIISLRADKDTSRRIKRGTTTDTYTAQEYALHDLVSDREKANADSAIKPVQDSVDNVLQNLLLDQEFRIRDAIDAGVTAEAIPSPKWDGTSPTIEKDVDTAKESVRQNAGKTANRIMIPTAVKLYVKRDSTVRNLLRYTVNKNQGEVLVQDGDLPPVLWNLRVITAGSIYDSSNPGQNESITDIWGDNVLVYIFDNRVSLRQMSLGYIMRVRQGGRLTTVVKRWRDNPRDSDVIQVSIIEDEKIVAATAGYQITNTLHSV